MNKLDTYRILDKATLKTEAIGAILIGLFAYTGAGKLVNFETFYYRISDIPLLGTSRGLAIVIPTVEILVAVLLLLKSTQLWGFYASATLLTVFTIYMALMLLFATKLPCSCAGVLEHMTWKQHIAFNIFFLLLTLFGIKTKLKQYKPNL